MADFASRLLDRAAGHAPTLRSAALPRVPAPAAADVGFVEAVAPASEPASLAPRQPFVAAAPLVAPPPAAAMAPIGSATQAAAAPARTAAPAELLGARELVSEPELRSGLARVQDSAPLARAARAIEPAAVRTEPTAVAPAGAVRAIEPASTSSERELEVAAVVELRTPSVSAPQAAALEPVRPARAAPPAQLPSGDLEEPRDAPAPAPPRSRAVAAAAPKLEIGAALAALGRALAQPPRVRATPTPAADEVHITIGHVDVRAAAPAPVSAPPARPTPSLSLERYLRRRPGSPR